MFRNQLKAIKNYQISKHKPRLWVVPGIDISYIKTTKVASTSIEQCLATYIHCNLNGGLVEEVDDALIKNYEKRYSRLVDIRSLRDQDLPRYLFTFVRNPLDRLYSCYVNKIVDASKAGRQRSLFWSHDITLDMTFDQFVRRVAEIPDERIDRHLRSQCYFLWNGNRLLPDFIGRFENISADWQFLAGKFGLPDLPHTNKSAKSKMLSSYTRETAEIASVRYRQDIELFGYSDAVRQLIESL